jgi:hypothetical protein
MEKINITDASVVDAVRNVMQTATTKAKGLMPPIMVRSPYQLYIVLEDGLNQEFDLGYGIMSLYSTQHGYSSICLLGRKAITIITSLGDGEILSTVKDTAGKVNIYKLSEYKMIIQNKTGLQFRFYISIM